MLLALLTPVGSDAARAADASAAPATDDHPVVDLRTWPTTTWQFSKLPDDEQSRMIRMGQALLEQYPEHLGPEVADLRNATRHRHVCTHVAIALATMPYAAPLIRRNLARIPSSSPGSAGRSRSRTEWICALRTVWRDAPSPTTRRR